MKSATLSAMSRIALILCSVLVIGAAAYAGWQTVRMLRLIAMGLLLVKDSMPFEQVGTENGPRILVAGDSTAVGTGVRHPSGSIAGRFGQDIPGADIRNIGVNGLKAEGLRQKLLLEHDKVDLVMLQIGANDIVQGTPMDMFAASLSGAFDEAKRIGTHVVALHCGNVGLAPLFPWPLGRIMRARTLQYREEYMRIAAEKGVIYVDLFHEAKDDPFRGELQFYGNDQFHPSELGYDEWYRQTRSAMERAGIAL